MKKIMLCLSLSLFFLHIQAQETEQKLSMHEAGFNITAFIDDFLAIGFQNNSLGPYLLTYKYLKNGKGLRVGLGGQVYKNKSTALNNEVSNSRRNLNLRIGMEWRKILHKRWTYYIGGDIVAGVDRSENKNLVTPFNENLNQSKSIGAGPVAGIIFNLNERMSFSTEATLYGTYSDRRTSGQFFNGTELESFSQKSKGYFIATVLPSFIFFNVSF